MPYVEKTITTGCGEVFKYKYFKIKRPQKKNKISFMTFDNFLWFALGATLTEGIIFILEKYLY